ncbi:hypothetical protein [Spiroplasma monobiae]|uniref:Uncharacterized protein n=1 Tax=Spiroplasma monobiae MQ-1 TaxID=1336748 RepID=A0A2K9LTJ7_SPISQ|nr:hypothetical protein [Spiroplasma monobiae]AUM62393.1 hypothetical protein SMONO_v1c01420 [Spiroplasma monobiae MQ-1]
MIFNKIEILYDKVCLPLKIKYSEIRKPTFMEFLILLIIIEHPDKTKNLQEILEKDFEIKNQSLFERALRELINFKVIEINKVRAGIGSLNMNTSIDNFHIDAKIQKEFKKGTYTISHDNKFQDVKYFIDPITRKTEILKEANWNKRVSDLKFSHRLSIPFDNSQLENKELIFSKSKDFMKDKSDIFGDDSFLKDILLEGQESINEVSRFKEYTKNDTAAIESWIEIFDNGTFKVKTDNQNLEDYLRLNPNISAEILKDVATKYEDKLKKIFRPETNFTDMQNFISTPDLLSNLNVKTTYNLILINDQYIESDNEIIKNKDLTKNIETIIFYNSKRNNKVIDIIDGKVIFYVGYIENETLQSNSFIYLDSKNASTAFLVAEKNIQSINLNIPVLYAYKNSNKILDLYAMFKTNIESIIEKFEQSLLEANYELAMNIYLVLERVGLESKVSKALEYYLSKTTDSGSNYSEMKKYLSEAEDRKLFLILDRVAKNLIVNVSKERTDDELFEIVRNYKFVDTKNILDIFNQADIQNNIDNIYKINDFLRKNSVDGWKFNVRNSLNILTDYFKNNNRAEMFDENKYNSDVWTQHANTLNTIGKITKELYMNNYAFVENNYSYLLNSLMELVGNSLDIENFDQYLINLSDSLIDFYKSYYKYKSEQFSTITDDMIEYKIQIIAGGYINKVEDALNEFIDKKIYNMPIELKLEWVKNVEKNSSAVDKILKNNDKAFKEALNIIFGKKREYTQFDLSKYSEMFGGK